jgi:hypothetical protein
MTMNRGHCWMNGELVPQANAALGVSTDAVTPASLAVTADYAVSSPVR